MYDRSVFDVSGVAQAVCHPKPSPPMSPELSAMSSLSYRGRRRATVGRREECNTPSRPQLPLGMEERNTPSLALSCLLCHASNYHFSPFLFLPPSSLFLSSPICSPHIFYLVLPWLLSFSSAPRLSQMNPFDSRGFICASLQFTLASLASELLPKCF